jgi:hypothetical protein
MVTRSLRLIWKHIFFSVPLNGEQFKRLVLHIGLSIIDSIQHYYTLFYSLMRFSNYKKVRININFINKVYTDLNGV